MSNLRLKLFMAATAAATAALTVGLPHTASAAMLPGRIIDDAIFNNSTSMTAAQIDAFLNGFPNSCISPNSGFSAIVPNGYSPTTGFSYGGYDTAGNVIATAAQVYGINPQVLLTTLQKEQSLVAGAVNYCNNGDDHKYAAAVGYGCPDGGTTYNYSGISLYRRNGVVHSTVGPTCVNSSAKAGFSQQVIRAAWLLKFGQQRSLGNFNWAVVQGNWNNSDDPQSCYSGPMTEGYRQICPSGATVYYGGITNIDGQAVHMDSGATAALYWYTPHFHGNQLFSDTYQQWFGNTILPYAFKSAGSPTIYLYVSGYKVIVTAMAVMQDYGVSPASIQTIGQATIDSIPSPAPADNISSTLSYLVKSSSDSDADGGSIYLVSVGKKYQIASMTQFAAFGFNEANIGYLPLSYINSIPSGGTLQNYVYAPNSATFQVGSAKKRLILNYATYISLNPADKATPLSYFIADQIVSGLPLSNNAALLKYRSGAGVYLLSNGTYHAVTTFDTFNCWGFEGALNMTVITPAQDNYIATIAPADTLSCLLNDGTKTYLMSRDRRFEVPAELGITTPTAGTGLPMLSAKLPTSGSQLGPYVKGTSSSGVWYVASGSRRSIPTFSNFSLINPSLTIVDTSSLAAIPAQGIKLGPGQAIKADNSAAVYIVSGDSRVLVPSSDLFDAYYRNWNSVETYPASQLDTYYPYGGTSLQKFYYNAPTSTTYLVEKYGCYSLSASQLTDYGQSQPAIAAAQTYDATALPNLNLQSCRSGSSYAKQPDQALVYWVENGRKHPILSWSALQQHSGQSDPYVITVSPGVLQGLATASAL